MNQRGHGTFLNAGPEHLGVTVTEFLPSVQWSVSDVSGVRRKQGRI